MPFGPEPFHSFRRPVERIGIGDRGVEDFTAVSANEVIVILEPAVVMIRPAGDGETADRARFGQKIQVPIDRAAADPVVGVSGERVDFVGGRVILVPFHQTGDQFPLPGASIFDFLPLHKPIIGEIFRIVNNKTCY